MPYWAIIFKPWSDQPVYHRPKAGTQITRCGRRIGEFTPWLPFKHVIKFGRPCKGCFS